MIKLIDFEISGHALFEDGTKFSIQATGQNNEATAKRVIDYGYALYLNRTIGVVGLNASGKTTLFNLFDGLNAFYLEDQSIDQTVLQDSLRGKGDIKVVANIANTHGVRYQVQTIFRQDKDGKWVVANEEIYRKQLGTLARKKDQFNFKPSQLVQRRSDLRVEVKKMLSSKDSSFRAYKGDESVSRVFSIVDEVDASRIITFIDMAPTSLIQYLDESIEYLDCRTDKETHKLIDVRLKFKGQKDSYVASTFQDIMHYLSSGTIRGITLFYQMFKALRAGATLLIDEVELHINKRIIEDFIAFFQNSRINIAEASLVYSTQYLELIDDSVRKDENYILAKKQRTRVYRYSDLDIRGDLKKSEVFKSNYIGGTAPIDEHLAALKKELTKKISV
ncbi:ATP-binding protein [Lacticaseibacillus casei]|uniref:AAA family ATPase n=1 Tax=Lacticaseibacillus huelsenbergensis TaxID=3035291 RepID=A0ABY8DWG5_9LACO|nr:MULTISPECIES: AAA family ATPase [Lacticaseibacillus]MDG3062525.1 AAA family ATPase [Lacticaseibacillus sp. BCRC 81376]QVI36619.1 ATP-binding protein [Lacticaseibacillus casei]QXG58412.1 ATP-binding protein [Lacticaseibacillus casei]WFB40122.1 AAA family ATPase [Lacticaseibacillus huelsenbergensis]WFB41854.1 AAA family ATPase [Lacticaseibacillus huelsenbergensis]